MQRRKLLHIITERVNCEPRGITVDSNIMQFEWILGDIFAHRIDTNDPFRGLGQALTWVFHWNSTPPNADVSGELLEVESGEYLTLDYARGEVTLQLDGAPKMRCALTPEAVHPLFQTVWAHTEPDPYGETPKFPKRSLVRLVCKRSGEVSSGIDVFYPICGEERIRSFLPRILLGSDSRFPPLRSLACWRARRPGAAVSGPGNWRRVFRDDPTAARGRLPDADR